MQDNLVRGIENVSIGVEATSVLSSVTDGVRRQANHILRLQDIAFTISTHKYLA